MVRQIIDTTTETNIWGDTKVVKKIKDEMFCDTIQLSKSESFLAKGERNDCVVRAFMVTLDVSYDIAHKWVKKMFKRQDRKGTYTSRYLSDVIGRVKNGKKLTMMGWCPKYAYGEEKKKQLLTNPKYKKITGYTVKSFMEQHPKGRYFIIVKGHALGLVDGVLYGNKSEQYEGFRRHVHYVVKIG
jgi:hypothetical protein